MIVTVAPGTAALVVSATLPTMLPYRTWAWTGPGSTVASASSAAEVSTSPGRVRLTRDRILVLLRDSSDERRMERRPVAGMMVRGPSSRLGNVARLYFRRGRKAIPGRRGDTFSRMTRSGLAPLLLASGALLGAMAATPSPPAIRFREAA